MQPPPFVSYGPEVIQVATPVPAMVASVIQRHEVAFTQRQRKTMTILSGLQIAIGILCAMIYLVLIVVPRDSTNNFYLNSGGTGIWCGGLYILAGSLGVSAARQNRPCLMISSMIFSTLCSLILWVVIVLAAISIGLVAEDKTRPCSSASSSNQYYHCVIYNFSGYQAADSILIILSVVEFVISVWCSVLCPSELCKAYCMGRCYNSSNGYRAPMVYSPVNSGQQVFFVQHSGVAGGQAMNVLPNQPFYVGMQVPVNIAHPTAALSATATPGYRTGVAGPPGYPASHVENVHAGGADNGKSGEVTKDKMANGH